MAEYIEREAALKSVCYDCSTNENKPFCGIACADYERIKSIPAADVVERASGIIGVIPTADVRTVVLCRECKNYIERSGACAYLVVGMREDDFCSYGKKREEQT